MFEEPAVVDEIVALEGFCRKCGRCRPVYVDVIANQQALRCRVCHWRVADGPLIPRQDRALLLSRRELSGQMSEWDECDL